MVTSGAFLCAQIRKMAFFRREPAMSKHLLTPQGDFSAVGLGRRLAAMFYDFLLCTALLIVTASSTR
jgi:hypothetical protein